MEANLKELKQERLNGKQSQSKSQQQPVNQTPQSHAALGNQPSTDAEKLHQNLDIAFSQTLEGLNAGDAHNMAHVILSEVEDSTNRAEKLASIVEYFRSPDTAIKMAYILAAQRIAEKKSLVIPRPPLEIAIPPLELPPLPNFSRFYQSSDLSQPQLGDGSNTNEPNTKNNGSDN